MWDCGQRKYDASVDEVPVKERLFGARAGLGSIV